MKWNLIRLIKEFRNDSKQADAFWERTSLRDGYMVFPIYIEDVEKIYDDYDNDDITINANLLDFLQRRSYYIPRHHTLKLEFYTPPMSEKEKARTIENFRMHYTTIADETFYSMFQRSIKDLALTLLAVVLLIINVELEKKSQLSGQMITIFAWVALWTAVGDLLFEYVTDFKRRKHALQLRDAVYEFKPLAEMVRREKLE